MQTPKIPFRHSRSPLQKKKKKGLREKLRSTQPSAHTFDSASAASTAMTDASECDDVEVWTHGHGGAGCTELIKVAGAMRVDCSKTRPKAPQLVPP